jgi:hypothetical protein
MGGAAMDMRHGDYGGMKGAAGKMRFSTIPLPYPLPSWLRLSLYHAILFDKQHVLLYYGAIKEQEPLYYGGMKGAAEYGNPGGNRHRQPPHA